ncbi:MAG: DUF1858 domain-containing protein [Candidatus Woesearchaeota archaeon]
MKISKETKISDVASKYPETIEIFFKYGMHCIGCPASRMETIEDGCRGHGISDDKIDELIDELNKLVGKAKKGKDKK